MAFLGHEIKLPIGLMIPAPKDPPSKHKWLSNLQETYAKIFGRMYTAQNRINRTNARLYSNKKAPFAVGDIVWYFAKRQVAEKPPKLTQKWTGLYRVSHEICLELTAIADPRNIVRTTIHYVTAYKGVYTMHHSIKRPDQLVLPCPDTEEDCYSPGPEHSPPWTEAPPYTKVSILWAINVKISDFFLLTNGQISCTDTRYRKRLFWLSFSLQIGLLHHKFKAVSNDYYKRGHSI